MNSRNFSRQQIRDRFKEAWDQKKYRKAKEKFDRISACYQDKYRDLEGLIPDYGWETAGVHDVALIAHQRRLQMTNRAGRINQDLKLKSKAVNRSRKNHYIKLILEMIINK